MTERITTAIDDFKHASSLSKSGSAASTVINTNPRMSISMAELRSEGLSERLRLDPLRHMRALEAACNMIAKEERPGYDTYGRSCVRPLRSLQSLLRHGRHPNSRPILHTIQEPHSK